jgi:hypothetical protein
LARARSFLLALVLLVPARPCSFLLVRLFRVCCSGRAWWNVHKLTKYCRSGQTRQRRSTHRTARSGTGLHGNATGARWDIQCEERRSSARGGEARNEGREGRNEERDRAKESIRRVWSITGRTGHCTSTETVLGRSLVVAVEVIVFVVHYSRQRQLSLSGGLSSLMNPCFAVAAF